MKDNTKFACSTCGSSVDAIYRATEDKCLDCVTKECYEDMAKYESEVSEHNKTLIKSIGKYANRHFKNLLDYCDVTGKIEVVDKPYGSNQNEKYGCFKEVWVHQWSVGWEGDSFEGYIYAKFDSDKWIKVPYSC